MLKLIAGYIHPDSGRILVDGQPLPTSGSHDAQAVSLSSYYPHIGYLTQEPAVFDGTLFENLIYGL